VRAGIRVVVAEDLTLLRDGLVRLLAASGFEVVGAVADGAALLGTLVAHRPEVAVVDVRLPPTFTDEGLRAAIAARKRLPGLPILVLSQYVEQVYARELLSDGGGSVGYLLKDRVFDVDDFVAAVCQVADGGTVMDPEVVTHLLAQPANQHPIDRLTTREREVLQLIAQGRSNSAIASTLDVTEHAVSFHTANIFDKLDLPPSSEDNRRVLAMLAFLNNARPADTR
jgi:DNA-binding NarL/FixJ family response regulator